LMVDTRPWRVKEGFIAGTEAVWFMRIPSVGFYLDARFTLATMEPNSAPLLQNH
jgi:hypothetical protein